MSESAELQQDEDEYWRSSKEFVRVVIADLNRSLKENGVTKRKRKQICESFAFSIANFLDQQWFKVDGKTQYPLLCFTQSFLDSDTSLADISPISIPHKSVELHAMVCDEVEWFFDEVNERETAVSVGNVGEETKDTDQGGGQPDSMIASPCPACKGTGQCYCIRKGPGLRAACPRCHGSGECKHCRGSGDWVH